MSTNTLYLRAEPLNIDSSFSKRFISPNSGGTGAGVGFFGSIVIWRVGVFLGDPLLGSGNPTILAGDIGNPVSAANGVIFWDAQTNKINVRGGGDFSARTIESFDEYYEGEKLLIEWVCIFSSDDYAAANTTGTQELYINGIFQGSSQVRKECQSINRGYALGTGAANTTSNQHGSLPDLYFFHYSVDIGGQYVRDWDFENGTGFEIDDKTGSGESLKLWGGNGINSLGDQWPQDGSHWVPYDDGGPVEPDPLESLPAEQLLQAEQSSLTLWQALESLPAETKLEAEQAQLAGVYSNLTPAPAETKLEAEQAELTGAFYALVSLPAEIVLQAEPATLTGAFHQLTAQPAEQRLESEQQSLDIPTGLQSLPAEQRQQAEQGSLTLWQALTPVPSETKLEAEQAQLTGAFYALVSLPAEIVLQAEQGSMDAPISLQSRPAEQRHEAEQGTLTLWQDLTASDAEVVLQAEQAQLTGAYYQLVSLPAEIVLYAEQGTWPDLSKPLDVSRIQLIRTTKQFQIKRTTKLFSLVKH